MLKTIFNEALYREEIYRNPVQGIGNIKYEPKEVGIFTEEELKMLFPVRAIGVWQSTLDCNCFLLAASTGMRRSKILALQWRDINFEGRYLTVNRAWKGKELGLSKWNKTRYVPLSSLMISRLKDLRYSSLNCLDDDLVFCYSYGHRLHDTWWKLHFRRAMKEANFR